MRKQLKFAHDHFTVTYDNLFLSAMLKVIFRGRSPKVHGPKVHKAQARAFDYFECFRSLLAVLKFLEVLTTLLAVVGATIDL